MLFQPPKGIALGGFMGVGKSTVGRALAARLGWPMIDTDAWIAARHGPIARQFAEEGEAAFRAREAACIRQVARSGGQVVSTGGGAWVSPQNRAVLRATHHLVVLHAPLDVIRARVGAGSERPLWNESVRARWLARQDAYADADLRVDTSAFTVQEAVDEVMRWLSTQR